MDNGGDTVDTSVRTAVSQTIIEAVSDAEGVAPEQLCPPEYEPLYAVIDPEALDALFTPRDNRGSLTEGTVAFTYCGYEITVEADGSVHLEK